MDKLKEKTITMTTTLLASNDNKNTYAYSKELVGLTGKHGIFILLYPTRDEDNFYVEDMTNVHVLNHMMEFGLTSYTVVNLFSQVTKSRLSTRGLRVDDDNLQYIEKEIFGKMNMEDTIVVIAWGNSHQTSRAVNQSKQRILEYWLEHFPNEKLYQLATKGMEPNTGIHPLFMGIRYGNAIWSLEPYPTKKILRNLQRAEQEKIEIEQAKQKNKIEGMDRGSDTDGIGDEEPTAELEEATTDSMVVVKPVKGKQKREKKTSQYN